MARGCCAKVDWNKHPDGPYGWLVVAAGFCFFLNSAGVYVTFSLIYTDVVNTFHSLRGDTGWIISICGGTSEIVALVASPIVERYGCRPLGMLGGLLLSVALVTSAFALNIHMMYVTLGLMGGFGNGLLELTAVVPIQSYFDKRRACAAGVALLGYSMAGLVLPPLLTYAMDTYGWRGVLILQSGLAMQCIPFAMLCREPPTSRVCAPKEENTEKTSPKPIEEECGEYEHVVTRGSKSKWRPSKNSVVRSVTFWLFAVCFVLKTSCDDSILQHFPNSALAMGIRAHFVAYLLVVFDAFVISARLLVICIGDRPWINRLWLFGGSVLCSGIIVTCIPLASTFLALAAIAAAKGATTGIYNTLRHTVLVDLVGLKRLPRAMGLISIFLAPMCLLTVPIAGWIVDLLGGYDPAFYCLGGAHIFAGVLVVIIIIIGRIKKRSSLPAVI